MNLIDGIAWYWELLGIIAIFYTLLMVWIVKVELDERSERASRRHREKNARIEHLRQERQRLCQEMRELNQRLNCTRSWP